MAAYGASPPEWEAIVRRANIRPELKLAALIVSSYAEFSDRTGRAAGEGIHPGLARLALDMRCSYATAQRRLAWLRDVGLLEMTFRAGARSKFCDEYRLILSTEAINRIKAPDPTEYDNQIQELRDTHRKQASGTSRSGITKLIPENQDQVSTESRSGITLGDAPPRAPTISCTETSETSVRSSRSGARERCDRHPAILLGSRGCQICRSLNLE